MNLNVKAYNNKLKPFARKLRLNQTDIELKLWQKIRRKQILNVQFYRQKSIGNYIVDFYAPKANLVIELDGSQHFDDEQVKKDNERDIFLKKLGLTVLRYDNGQIRYEFKNVLEEIWRVVGGRV